MLFEQETGIAGEQPASNRITIGNLSNSKALSGSL